jgi:hypothetical protein
MGRLQATEMANLAELDQALSWHLTANHYPPVPASMIEPCKEAIAIAASDDPDRWDQEVDLPEGVSYRGLTSAPVYAIVEQHHLEPFVEKAATGEATL